MCGFLSLFFFPRLLVRYVSSCLREGIPLSFFFNSADLIDSLRTGGLYKKKTGTMKNGYIFYFISGCSHTRMVYTVHTSYSCVGVCYCYYLLLLFYSSLASSLSSFFFFLRFCVASAFTRTATVEENAVVSSWRRWSTVSAGT